MTAARHANDARVEAQRLRALLEQIHQRADAGQPIDKHDVNQALQLARITEYHVSRTMVAIDHGSARASDRPSPESSKCL